LAKRIEKDPLTKDAAGSIWTSVDNLLDALQDYAAQIGHESFFSDDETENQL
jgi:hypothetical protein